MNFDNVDSDWIFNVCIFPLVEMFLFFAVSTYFFLLKIPMTGFNFMLCYLMGVVFLFFCDKKNFIKSLILGTVILFFPIILCMFVWDYSWDGNAYHKLCVGLLKGGWNPIYQPIYDAVAKAGMFAEGTASSAFYDGYPKASYIIGAVVYAFTGKIEAGKMYNLLSTFSAVGIVYYVCRNVLSLTRMQSAIVSFILCCNTVTASQAITYYNDGLLQNLVFIVCAEFFYLYKVDFRGKISIHHLIITMSIIIGVNLKYSAMLLFFLPCTVYFVYVLAAKRERLALTIAWYMAIVFSALILFGLTSYVHNIVFYHNPFYTLIGEGKEDVLSPSIPFAYREMPNFFRIVCSIFAPFSNNYEMEGIAIKMPFFFSKDELILATHCYDTRMGGWGVFYSGLFCISLVVFVWRLIIKKFDLVNRMYLVLCVVSFIPAIFINCLNNARYWPFPFFFPCWTIYAVYSHKGKIWRNIVRGIAIISLMNIIPIGLGYPIFAMKTFITKNELENVALSESIDTIYVNHPGFVYNLYDCGICFNHCSNQYVSENRISYFSIYFLY